MKSQYTAKQRKEIYLKIAERFDNNEETRGLCSAFKKYVRNEESYLFNTLTLFIDFPELELVWSIKVEDTGQLDVYSLFPGMDEDGSKFRALLLTFASTLIN